MTDEAEDVKQVRATFPFPMVIFAFFATGFIFLLVDLPLLVEWVQPRRTPPPRAVSEWFGVVRDFWAPLLSAQLSAAAAFLFNVAALVVGFVVQQLASGMAWFWGKVWTWPPWFGPSPYYVPSPSYLDAYPRFAHWLHHHPKARTAWEWEFFNYYLSWGIAFNVVVAGVFLLVGHLRLSGVVFRWLIVGAAVWFVLAHGLQRSRLQRRMLDFYQERAGASMRETPPSGSAGLVEEGVAQQGVGADKPPL